MKLNNISKILIFGLFSSLFFERSLWMIYLQSKGFSMSEISFFQIGLNIAMFISEIPSGVISDRFGRKISMFLGLVCTITYLVGMLVAENNISVFIFFIIYGFGIALLSGTEQSLIYDELLFKRRKKLYHKIIGRYNFISISALAISSFLGGVIAEYNAWDMIFYLGVISQFIAMVVLFSVVDFYKRNFIHDRENIPTFKVLSNISLNIYILIISLSIFQGVFSSITLYYQAVLKDNSFSLLFISGIYSISFLFSAFSSVFSGWIADLIGEKRSIILFSLLLLCFLGLSLMFGGIWVALTFIIILISYEIIDTSLGVLLNHSLSSNDRGTILSTVNSLCSLIMIFSFWLIGTLSNYLDFSKIIFASGIFCMLVFITIFNIYSRNHNK
ncbi:MFS transporter [Gallibacterium sp. AGMB14963]|uniref:MFS transporter n=1 Tax=Gallibacterium faecale TaxID=3019086 RepID=UPI0022F18072|nr:MFS transporter [Gallibacterium sp. AGMB14963]MDA3979743.1 MFS transporter [Gallibacterium sp. AGMB14963]